ncbi:MAG TPA: M23 family metallopeptidase [Geminicoccaceae bacterium]|nr:M23 family metallopeptidase [Geminicoccaceae bacterium]
MTRAAPGMVRLAAAFLLGFAAPASAGDVFTPLTAVPFEPTTTPVPGTDDRWHFVYELHLANTRSVPATLEHVQVTDASATEGADGAGRPPRVLADFEAASFAERLRQLDNRPAADATIEPNSTRLFLIDLASAAPEPLPTRLRHVLRFRGQGTDLTSAEPVQQQYPAAAIEVTRDLPVLRPPLAGEGWVAFNGCCAPGGVHRATALPVNGRLHYTQRFAIDWMKLDAEGRLRSGPVAEVASYAGYGASLLAVADGRVVAAQDGLPDQVPPDLPDPSTITIENVDGNHVVLDLGGGLFAFYAHMQKDSVKVSVGQEVEAGAVLGLLGNSGNSSAPHLHFHLMDTASVLGSEGLPYVLQQFELVGRIPPDAVPDDLGGDYRRFLQAAPESRSEQFPLDMDVVNFTP